MPDVKFPRSKLWRQTCMTRTEVLAKNSAKFSGYFRASFAVQNDPPTFPPKTPSNFAIVPAPHRVSREDPGRVQQESGKRTLGQKS